METTLHGFVFVCVSEFMFGKCKRLFYSYRNGHFLHAKVVMCDVHVAPVKTLREPKLTSRAHLDED